MERALVTIEDIKEIKPIEGADKIEVARVRDWWVVVKKDEFKVGMSCVYFEIDSFLPIKPEFEFLLKGSKPKIMIVDGKEIEGIRLKTIRLRGTLSQGLIMPLAEMTLLSSSPLSQYDNGTDITEFMGVIKYEAPISACMQNIARGNFPSFLKKTDEERIQNCSKLLDLYKDEPIYISEKLDGTSATYYNYEGEFGVCSRNMDLKESDSVYWKIAKELKIKEMLPDEICIQGEIVGDGIQGNPLKLVGQQFFLFNVYDIKDGRYYDFGEMMQFCYERGFNPVPIIMENKPMDTTVEQLLELADDKSLLNNNCLREGIVVRSMKEVKVCERGCPTRLSFKAINNSYLLKVEK